MQRMQRCIKLSQNSKQKNETFQPPSSILRCLYICRWYVAVQFNYCQDIYSGLLNYDEMFQINELELGVLCQGVITIR